MLVADLSNRIRKITPDGIVTNAQLNHPTGVAVDAAGGILTRPTAAA